MKGVSVDLLRRSAFSEVTQSPCILLSTGNTFKSLNRQEGEEHMEVAASPKLCLKAIIGFSQAGFMEQISSAWTSGCLFITY
ncbi:uncharacterized protein LOC144317207 isoform X3 [Canis aureus]